MSDLAPTTESSVPTLNRDLVPGQLVQPRRDDPQLHEAMMVDRAVPADPQTKAAIAREMQRGSRRYLKPTVRLLSFAAIWVIVVIKRVLPFQFRNHDAIDSLGVWFLRRVVSADGVYLLLRHFVVETQLINFVIRNAGDPTIPLAQLEPTRVEDLHDNAVIEHDINIYNLVLDLGRSPVADLQPTRLDYRGLDVPPIDCPRSGKWLELDLETSLYLMNVVFCLFTTEDEYERAVNSFQLDESLLSYLADICGDSTFRTWTPLKFPMWISINRDVPRDLYWHAIVNEYAHTHLRRLRDANACAEV